jgi:hypothetical protein
VTSEEREARSERIRDKRKKRGLMYPKKVE